MRRYHLFAFSICVLAAVAPGCKHGDPLEKFAETPVTLKGHAHPGWTEIKSAGVAMSFPPDVLAQNLSQASTNAIIERAKERHPTDVKALDKLNSDPKNQPFKLMATSQTAGPTGFKNNMNLMVLRADLGATVESLLKEHQKAMVKLSVPGSIVAKKVKLSFGEAGYIESEHPRPNTENRAVSTYLVPHNGKLYMFTFGSGQNDKEAWRATAEDIMNTVKFDK